MITGLTALNHGYRCQDCMSWGPEFTAARKPNAAPCLNASGGATSAGWTNADHGCLDIEVPFTLPALVAPMQEVFENIGAAA